ncbi:MAG: hypothetical protein GX862_04150 [Leucobacter sp.]|nr:hypothetical protein [Leucobacter sp.]
MSDGKSNIVTPCCGTPLIILTRREGPAYLQYEVPDEIMCNGEKCYNTWNAKGEADEYNK